MPLTLTYYCDDKRHLVCQPYSIRNLHWMAIQLGINQCWFHKDHYDIPKRRVAAITKLCTLVSTRSIIEIIRGADHRDFPADQAMGRVRGRS